MVSDEAAERIIAKNRRRMEMVREGSGRKKAMIVTVTDKRPARLLIVGPHVVDIIVANGLL